MGRIRTIITVIFAAAAALCISADARAAVQGLDKDAFAVVGVYTPIRFNRGQLDDYIPDSWNLEFFSKERTGLSMLFQGLFTGLLKEEVEDLSVVPPESFERLSQNIYRRVYVSYLPQADQRFKWPKVQDYCKLLNIRYAMFGEVQKLEMDPAKSIMNIELQVYIYDSKSQQVTFSQLFKNEGRLEKEYGYNSLMRIHRAMKPEIVNFMTTDMGRAAMVVYDQFMTALETSFGVNTVAPAGGDSSGKDTAAAGVGTDAGADAGSGRKAPPVDTPVVEQPEEDDSGQLSEFKSWFPCKAKGDSLIITGGGNMAMLSCVGSVFKVNQIAENFSDDSSGAAWPAIGEFTLKGSPQLALSSEESTRAEAAIYGPMGNNWDFRKALFSFSGDFEKSQGAYTAAGDLDGDGRDELIIASSGENSAAIYKMKPGSKRLLEQLYGPFKGYKGGLYPAAGDFDGNGSDELVLSRSSGSCRVQVFKRAGSVTDTAHPLAAIEQPFDGYTGPCFAATGDLDGDGKDELILTKAENESAVIIYRIKAGKITELDSISDPMDGYAGALFPAAGDFDGDGTDELVLATAEKRGDAMVLKLRDGKLDIQKTMAVIKRVFAEKPAGIRAAAGVFKPMAVR